MSSQSFLLFFTLPIIAKTTAVKIPISNPTKATSPPLEYLDNRTSNIMIFNLITNNINHYLFNPTLITITIKAMNINANAIVAILSSLSFFLNDSASISFILDSISSI